MHRFFVPAIAAALLLPAASAAAEEFDLTCAWDLGARFQLKISEKGVAKNGRPLAEQVKISEEEVAWHESGMTGAEYDITISRRSGVMVATTFNKSYNRKVENKAICVKSEGSEQPGF